MKQTSSRPWCLAAFVAFMACSFPGGAALAAQSSPRPAPDAVQNLRAFARLYGYVRYFHPSDEAAAIDWNRFAIYGAGKVRTCKDRPELEGTLRTLFAAVAPTVQIYEEGAKPAPVWMPSDRRDLVPVAWRHEGIELSQPNVYRSSRSNRERQERRFKQLVQDVEEPLAGRRIRLSAWSRSDGQDPGAPARLWMSAKTPGVPATEDTNWIAVPLVSAQWRRYEATVELPPQGTSALWFGLEFGRRGSVWLDDCDLAIEKESGQWEPIVIQDGGFEDSVSIEQSEVWHYLDVEAKRDTGAHGGDRCVRVQPDTLGFFNRVHLEPGEFVDKPLDRGLACRVPLCLLSDDRHTLPQADTTAFGQLRREVSAVRYDSLSGRDIDVRLGDVTVAWNVLQHFYPYFDLVPTDWDTVLTGAITRALPDQDEMGLLWILKGMAAALHDGHASSTRYLPDARRRPAVLPVWLEVVDGGITVVATGDPEIFRRGDVIRTIDGRNADSLLAVTETRYSGSPQYLRARALGQLGRGDDGQVMRVTLRRDDQMVDLEADCRRTIRNADRRDSIQQVEPGIWYVKLYGAPMEAIDSVMNDLSRARGVIFDLRGYPRNNHEVISHLLTAPDTSGAWMQIPQILYPDRERIAGWAKYGWHMQPKEPHIGGKVVFLTNATAISYAESVLGFVEGYHLGEIVGEPTAGANGNVNPIALPGDYVFAFTGMKVVKHDGSQQHLIGIRPTVPIHRTLRAIREGRDEYIEKALELIKS